MRLVATKLTTGNAMQALVRNTALLDTSVTARAALSAGIERIFNGLPKGRGWASFPFNTLTLSSRYQPIFRVESQTCIGYEGLVTGTNLSGNNLSPETIFALSANHDEELFLDWLCRALHMRNFINYGEARGSLFINACPDAAVEDPHHPDVFSRMMAFYGVNPRDIVIEILETGVRDEAQLMDAADLYRSIGCRVAIDDFGVGYSNFDRLWRLRPDIVKLDRSLIRHAARESYARTVLANTLHMIKECGAEVVVEGVEERLEAQLAHDLGADYVQGFYFARPGQVDMPTKLTQSMFSVLRENEPVSGFGNRTGSFAKLHI
jgi:EAL domain-containing protein (putative c-di-GMP-specific phosphodiesterase class I)